MGNGMRNVTLGAKRIRYPPKRANLYLECCLSIRLVIAHYLFSSLLYCHRKELRGQPRVTSAVATTNGGKTDNDVEWELVGKSQWSLQGYHHGHVAG